MTSNPACHRGDSVCGRAKSIWNCVCTRCGHLGPGPGAPARGPSASVPGLCVALAADRGGVCGSHCPGQRLSALPRVLCTDLQPARAWHLHRNRILKHPGACLNLTLRAQLPRKLCGTTVPSAKCSQTGVTGGPSKSVRGHQSIICKVRALWCCYAPSLSSKAIRSSSIAFKNPCSVLCGRRGQRTDLGDQKAWARILAPIQSAFMFPWPRATCKPSEPRSHVLIAGCPLNHAA